eukprot:scaffold18514_cov112-Isochrysis_galbana.AAC.1
MVVKLIDESRRLVYTFSKSFRFFYFSSTHCYCSAPHAHAPRPRRPGSALDAGLVVDARCDVYRT